MNIGKREQIVLGGACTLLAIGAFHFFIFQPHAAEYRRAKQDMQAKEEEFRQLSRIEDVGVLDKYNQQTFAMAAEVKEGIGKLGMVQNPAFSYGLPTDLKIDFPEGMTPEAQEALRNQKYTEHLYLQFEEQITLIMQEIQKLQDEARAGGRPQLNFLQPQVQSFERGPDGSWQVVQAIGWGLPTALPAQLQTSEIWDQIQKIAETKDTLSYIQDQASELYVTTRQTYENELQAVGIDADRSKKLAQYGEFVPLFYKLGFASLIQMRQRENPTPVLILQEELNRVRLFGLLEIVAPIAFLPGTTDTEQYFSYHQVKSLNETLKVMSEVGIAEVVKVTMGGYSFLEQLDVTLADPGAAVVATGAADVGLTGMTAEQILLRAQQAADSGDTTFFDESGVAITPAVDVKAKKAGDIGYAIPITFRVRTNNKTLWSFVYEMLRRFPLAELHSLKVDSLGTIPPPERLNPANPEYQAAAALSRNQYGEDTLIADVQFIFVLQLFNTLDKVRGLEALAQLGGAAGAPGAAAPAAAGSNPAPAAAAPAPVEAPAAASPPPA